MLWRKGDRIRKSLLLHQQPAYQIPQAMARHNPGEFPSANVRTAPTPSEPNTPIAEPGFIVAANAPTTIIPQAPLPEEEAESPPPSSSEEPRQASMLPDENAVVQNNQKIQEEEEDKRSQEEVMSSSSIEEPASEIPQNPKQLEKEEAPALPQVEAEQKKIEIIEEKMTNLNTKNEDDNEDRPQPPDDDTVPPVDDNVPDDDVESGEEDIPTAAIVDNDEDDL